jgi:hypothetical protein
MRAATKAGFIALLPWGWPDRGCVITDKGLTALAAHEAVLEETDMPTGQPLRCEHVTGPTAYGSWHLLVGSIGYYRRPGDCCPGCNTVMPPLPKVTPEKGAMPTRETDTRPLRSEFGEARMREWADGNNFGYRVQRVNAAMRPVGLCLIYDNPIWYEGGTPGGPPFDGACRDAVANLCTATGLVLPWRDEWTPPATEAECVVYLGKHAQSLYLSRNGSERYAPISVSWGEKTFAVYKAFGTKGQRATLADLQEACLWLHAKGAAADG